jgi:hypothetical protein
MIPGVLKRRIRGVSEVRCCRRVVIEAAKNRASRVRRERPENLVRLIAIYIDYLELRRALRIRAAKRE